MRLVEVEKLKENDVIADAVMSNDFQILLKKGTKLKRDYINKLIELGIPEVYVEESKEEIEAYFNEEVKKEIEKRTLVVKQSCENHIKKILKEHTFGNNSSLADIQNEVEDIMVDILNNEKVVEKVYEIRKRSLNLYDHSIQVCCLCLICALRLSINRNKIINIGVAAMLHDLGMRYTTMVIQNKDINNLPASEREEFKKHTIYAYTALEHEDWLSNEIKNMILYHHETIDGTGYPLHKKDISKEIQILAVCDLFDEMNSGIGHKRNKIWEIIKHLRSISGQLYDKEIIDAIINFIAMYPIGTKVVLNDGSVGIVVKQNEGYADKPIIQIITKGKIICDYPCESVILLNLVREEKLEIITAQ